MKSIRNVLKMAGLTSANWIALGAIFDDTCFKSGYPKLARVQWDRQSLGRGYKVIEDFWGAVQQTCPSVLNMCTILVLVILLNNFSQGNNSKCKDLCKNTFIIFSLAKPQTMLVLGYSLLNYSASIHLLVKM
jgi:hypothetical protein